jgi:hypothetical protein
MSLRGRAVVALLALLLTACGDEQTPPPLARFDQPNRVDFVCVLNGEPIARDHCQNDVIGDGVALHALVTQSARGEIAAVNLETREVLDSRRDIPGFTFTPVGEMPVALIVPPGHPELTYVADYGSRDIRVLSTSALVSAREGDPTLRVLRLALDEAGALVVLAADESVSGRADLRVIAPTDMVLAPDESALIVAARDVGHVIWLPIQRCRGGGPDCIEGLIDEAAITAVPLQGSIDLAAAPSAPANGAAVYQRLCDFTPEPTPPVEPAQLPDPAAMTTPRPAALAIDADCPDEGPCTPRVLVADEALPLIHALDLDVLAAGGDPEAAVLAPLVTGAPTVAVVVTPWVPATVDEGGETQFVYAIDASDGSVLVLENGRVLSVNASAIGRPDRLALQTQAGATALEILTPAFDEHAGAEQWLDADDCTEELFPSQDPARLRGVFLAAAHTDGNVRIVDIHDMELRACRACPVTDEPLPVLIRHQARLAQNFVPGDDDQNALSGAPVSEPQFGAGGLGFGVRANGTTGNPDVPGLDCIACTPGLLRAFPPDSVEQEDQPAPAPEEDAGADDVDVAEACTEPVPALVCGDPDPWAGSSEQWTARFEGPIPGTIGGRGRFIPQGSEESVTGALELTAEIDFCDAGVQGEDDVAPWFEDQTCDQRTDERLLDDCGCGAAEDGTTVAERCESLDRGAPGCIDGDQIVLTNVTVTDEVLETLEGPEREKCIALRAALEQEDALPIGFEIRRAFADRVVLRSALSRHYAPYAAAGVTTFADLQPCLDPGLLSIEVRTLNQYTVTGTQSGFQHRVRENAAGRCVIDTDADPLLQGRAQFGCTYRTRGVEFRMHRPQPGEPTPAPGTALLAGVGSPATKLRVDVASSTFGTTTVVAVQLRYNEIDNQLYLVDVHRRGLVPIQLNPVRQFASGSFN